MEQMNDEQMNGFQGPAKTETTCPPPSRARRKCCQFKILMIITLSSELQPEYQMNSSPVKGMPDAEKPTLRFARRVYFGAQGVQMWHRRVHRLQKGCRSPEKEMSPNLYGRRGTEACHHERKNTRPPHVGMQLCPPNSAPLKRRALKSSRWSAPL